MASPLDLEPAPSWAAPIAIGAFTTFFGTTLLQWIGGFGVAVSLATCCCLIPTSFVPLGVLTTMVALRRDPSLTPGQGFSVAFIGTGLGFVFWAGIAALTMDRAEFRELATRTVREASARDPATSMTEVEIRETAAALADIAPYLPLFLAAVLSVLAGFAGMLTVSTIARRQHRRLPPRDPSPHE